MWRLSLVGPRTPIPVPSAAAGSTYGDLPRPASRSLRHLPSVALPQLSLRKPSPRAASGVC
jgi:hypothetical protein